MQIMGTVTLIFRRLLSFLLCYASFVSVYIPFFKEKSYSDPATWLFAVILLVLAFISVSRRFRISPEIPRNKRIFFNLYRFCLRLPGPDRPSKRDEERAACRAGPTEATAFKPKENGNLIKLRIIDLNRIRISKKSAGILICCLLSFFSGFLNCIGSYSRGSGEEEIYQFSHSYSYKAMENSYKQQQPPLDYYFSSFAGRLFGESKFAVRFHAMLFYLILSLILPLGLWFFSGYLWITAVGVILFLCNAVISFYSAEGRPLSLALLTGFLFLFFYLSAADQEEGSVSQEGFFPILASQYLFAMSVGLQPVLVIISLFVSSFWLLPDKKNLFKKLFFSNVITAVLSLPFYAQMWFFGQQARKFRRISFESLLNYTANWDIDSFLKTYFFNFYKNMSFSFLLLIATLIVSAFIKKKLSKRILMIVSGLAVFPLFFDLVFKTAIFWDFNKRYIIVYSLFWIFFAVFSLKKVNAVFRFDRDFPVFPSAPRLFQIASGKKNLFERGKSENSNTTGTASCFTDAKNETEQSGRKRSALRSGLKAGFLITAAAVFLWEAYFQFSAVKNRIRSRQNKDVEKIYDYLANRGGPEDIAIELALTPIPVPRLRTKIAYRKNLLHDSERHPVIIDSYVHYYESPPFFHESTGDVIYHIDWKEIPKKSDGKIFFVVSTKREYDKAYESLSNFMEAQTVGNSAVFERPLPQKNRKEDFKSVLLEINRKTPKKYRGAIYETLLHYAYTERNRTEFDRLLTEYKDMETALDEIVPEYRYPGRFELRRRVKYFENLDFNKDPEENP